MSEVVIPLAQASNPLLAGGKAAALGRLINNGFNVPPGFVITTHAPQKMDHSLEKIILGSFDKLGAVQVAVRSSAVAEDGTKDAWAGQMDSFLNIKRNELIAAVQKCWVSASSDRAKAYAKQKKLKAGRVAVIVQAMVNGQVSGVAFSVHPVTKNQGHLIIEAAPGLAESVVSGTITPDNYVVNKQNGLIIEKLLATKKQYLSDTKIQNVANEIQKLEKHFDFPVDVEWTIDDHKLFILQSRPITTLG